MLSSNFAAAAGTLLVLTAAVSSLGQAQPVSTADLEKAADSNSAWLSYGRDYSGHRYVELDQITPANVDRLHPVWVFATGGENRGLEATPLLHEGVLYVSADGPWAVICRSLSKGTEGLRSMGLECVLSLSHTPTASTITKWVLWDASGVTPRRSSD